jgi:hypothetical protein
MILPKDLFVVRVSYYVDHIDETIALATTEREAREAVRKWYYKHKEDEGGWYTDFNMKWSKKYDVYYDKIEADGTIDRVWRRKDAEYTIHDVLV